MWWNRPKVTIEPFFELQTPITFFELEITSTMYILRERGISGDFESVQDEVELCKEKWISTLNPFRSEMTKTTILHKKCISERSRSTYLKQNDLERDFIHWKGSAILVGRFRTRRIFYRPQTCQNPQSKIAKIMIFWNILKIDLKRFWYRFRVQNSSKTPQVCIYDHISCTRPLPAELWKIDFFAKIVISAILKHMWPCIFWQSICPEGVINVICDWKWLL